MPALCFLGMVYFVVVMRMRAIFGTAAAMMMAAGLVFAQSSSVAKPVHKHASASAAHSKSSGKRKGKKAVSWKRRGQQKIDQQRTTQIQEALIREHYMSGKPSGAWDSETQSALQKYQADNGWQSKTTPDSRALIKLGLGPNHDHLLNPETAMTGPATPAHAPTAKVDDAEKP